MDILDSSVARATPLKAVQALAFIHHWVMPAVGQLVRSPSGAWMVRAPRHCPRVVTSSCRAALQSDISRARAPVVTPRGRVCGAAGLERLIDAISATCAARRLWCRP